MRKHIPVLAIFVAVAVAAMMTAVAVAGGSACSGKTKNTSASCAATCASKAKTMTASTCTSAEKAACASKLASTAGNGSRLVLGVAYLSCNGCASKVTKALQDVDGVQSVAVDYRSGTADVEFNSESIGSVELINAVEKAGYHAQVGPYSDEELAKFAKGEVPAVKSTTAKAGKTCDPRTCTGKKGT
jgi:copper chaperone